MQTTATCLTLILRMIQVEEEKRGGQDDDYIMSATINKLYRKRQSAVPSVPWASG